MQQLILTFFRDQIQKNIMAKFSNKLKKKLFLARFWPIFRIFKAKKNSNTMLSFRKKTMSQSQQRVQKRSKI